MSTATDLKPALAPPPGVTPNFIDPPSQGYVTVVVMVFVLSLTTPIVLARLYTRHFINRRLWWDDCRFQWIPYECLETMAQGLRLCLT